MGLDKDPEPIPSTSGTQPHHRQETPMEIDTSSVRDDGFGGTIDNNMIGTYK